MRLITIENTTGSTEIVNVDHIVSIATETSSVIINLSNGSVIRTKFTDIDHATDYVMRASSHSFSGTI